MPYKSWGCSICGAQAPIKYRTHGMLSQRMAWLRGHYKSKHPSVFAKSFGHKRKQTKTKKSLNKRRRRIGK